MSQNRGQSTVKKQSMKTKSQLPQLPQRVIQNNMRSRSQLMDGPVIQSNPKQVQTKRLYQKLRFLKKDISSHTSCTSSDTCHTNEYPISDITLERKTFHNHNNHKRQTFHDGNHIHNQNLNESAIQSRNESPELVSILSDRTTPTKNQDIIMEYEDVCDTKNHVLDNSEVIDDLQGTSLFDDFKSILPLQIHNFTIKQVSWDDFTACSDANSQWKAHTFWCIGYTYDIKMRKMKRSSNIRYRLVISSWAALTEKCWVRFKWSRLLEHETGHYLIGCICALEFKKRADNMKYTQNYRIEAQKLFNSTFNEYLQWEIQYDKETDHSRNVQAQKKWNLLLISKLQDYQTFFGEEVPATKQISKK